MTLTTEEEQLIREMHHYAVHVRHYARSRILDQNDALRHIFEQMSMGLVVQEVLGAYDYCNPDYELRKRRIFRALLAEGEVGLSSYKKISLALDTLRDFCVWKRGSESAEQAAVPGGGP